MNSETFLSPTFAWGLRQMPMAGIRIAPAAAALAPAEPEIPAKNMAETNEVKCSEMFRG